MCKPLDFENPDHKALANRIMNGDTVLFLGSGFSMGAVGHYRKQDAEAWQPLPDVKGLKRILSKEILSEENTEDTLKNICEDCQEENMAQYSRLMRNIFTVSSVAEFHKLYAEVEWKNIYTINVDNVVERAYEEMGKDLCPVYTEESIYHKKGDLVLYKLHGDAVSAPEKIVFSNSDYVVSTARGSDYRFEQLTSDLRTDNFVFVGTALNEEWDIDIRCEQADIFKISNKAYFVLKDCDRKAIKRISRRFSNAVFIQETAETFILKMRDYIGSVSTTERHISFEKWNFRRVRKQDYDVVNFLRPDLYLGAEPTWEDVFSDHDVIWEKTRSSLERFGADPQKPCTLIIGKPISGKTTMLYRFGVTLCEDWIVLEYTGDNFLEDLRECRAALKSQEQPVVVLVDDAGWILGRLQDILEMLDDRLMLVAAIREKEYLKRQHIFDDVVNSKVEKVMNLGRLTDEDLGRYLDKLSEKSFLGRYGRDYEISRQHAVHNLRERLQKKKEDPLLWLASRMHDDRSGTVLDQRIGAISDDIINNPNYNIKRFTVLLYFLDVIGDVGLKLSLFLDLYPMRSEELKNFFMDIQEMFISNIRLDSLRHMDYNRITVHGRFSEIIRKAVWRISQDELESMVEDIFRALNRKYYYKSRLSNSYPNFVLYTMLRSQNISELFRGGNGRKVRWISINRLYENLHDEYKDYHLYWLHRGISEIRMKQYDKARIHLEQAAATRIGYSYEIEHTSAILYFEQAIHLGELTVRERKALFESGLTIIRSQLDRRTNDAFTIHSFIVKTIQFYSKIGENIPSNLMKEILDYYDLARRRFELQQSTIRRNMLKCIWKYLSEHQGVYEYKLSLSQDELAYIGGSHEAEGPNFNVIDMIS